MDTLVIGFAQLTPELQASAGGKGGTLAKLFRTGYPVPDGFVILPPAFQDDKLSAEAWNQAQTMLDALRRDHDYGRFAVSSSALSEDSLQTSFAGEFDTVLNVGTDAEVREAIDTVIKWRLSERVKAYSTAHDTEHAHQLAVIVQRMVHPEIAGVLFTADPVTGSFDNMIGNYVQISSCQERPMLFPSRWPDPKGVTTDRANSRNTQLSCTSTQSDLRRSWKVPRTSNGLSRAANYTSYNPNPLPR
jgi:phosphoenolpyruvate synthase/pyruvate phosphate dikinase